MLVHNLTNYEIMNMNEDSWCNVNADTLIIKYNNLPHLNIQDTELDTEICSIEQVIKYFSKDLLDLNAQLQIILHQYPFDSTTKEQDQII